MVWVICTLAKALEHVSATVDVTNDPKLIAKADKIVFPMGAMRDCMYGACMKQALMKWCVKRHLTNLF